MKKIFLFIFISILGTFVSCCKVFLPNEKLSMKREDYKGNELKIDGYYYHHQEDENNKFTLIVFLYRNGIIISTRAYPTLDLSVVEEEMVKEFNEIQKSKVGWGVFRINYNSFEYEEWTSPTEGMTLRKSSGFIENDTIFCITEHFFSYNKKKYHVDQVYHFRQFSPKPDSTNIFIK